MKTRLFLLVFVLFVEYGKAQTYNFNRYSTNADGTQIDILAKTLTSNPTYAHTVVWANQSGVGNTNNFVVFADGMVTSAAITNAGHLRTATFSSTINNASSTSVSNVTVGSSPFSWTNNLGCNVFVIVDGSTTYSATWLDTTVQSSLAGGVTIPLQPGEWTKVTYTVAPGFFVKKW